MEITEVPMQERIDMTKQEIRNFEQQWLGRQADESKFSDLLSAHDRGEFRDWNKDIVNARVRDWQAQRDSARIDIRSMEISIANAKARLTVLRAAQGEEGA